jgi:hypothetical protein
VGTETTYTCITIFFGVFFTCRTATNKTTTMKCPEAEEAAASSRMAYAFSDHAITEYRRTRMSNIGSRYSGCSAANDFGLMKPMQEISGNRLKLRPRGYEAAAFVRTGPLMKILRDIVGGHCGKTRRSLLTG